MWSQKEYTVIYSSPTVNQLLSSKDVFIDRNIAFGLRVTMGFGKKEYSDTNFGFPFGIAARHKKTHFPSTAGDVDDTITHATKKKGYSRVYASYATQNYYEANSVKYDGNLPENHIHPNNTNGHSWCLQYERVTRYGLILGGGFHYGIRRYDITIRQDFSNFDPQAAITLKGVMSFERYPVSVNYCGPKFYVGYRLPLNKKWGLALKIGVAHKLFFDGNWDHTITTMSYGTDNGRQTKTVDITYTEMKFGREMVIEGHRSGAIQKFLGTKYFPNKLPYYECYVGIERAFDKRWIKNMTIGIEANRGWWMWDNVGSMIIWTSPSIDKLGSSRENYIDRNLSLGLRVGVGLWK
jgi:hypothetical protein